MSIILGTPTPFHIERANLNFPPGSTTLQLTKRRDDRANQRRQKRHTASYQNYRKAVKIAKMRAEEARKKQEGLSYGAGKF
ncbi:hypothetical protein ANN_17657 [Periplaneta americana]|uniref:Uncharacterized protein n=1 Tax=Periplaneta americana TaxID=6978 RepID=A0ABQ8SUZ7_PERAM|nr:hypothetical protein ANN_17657 [Periplaneta americana]